MSPHIPGHRLIINCSHGDNMVEILSVTDDHFDRTQNCSDTLHQSEESK